MTVIRAIQWRKVMANPKAYANTLLDKLIVLDDQTTGAYYDMGQILSAIQHGKLFDVLGYNSMHEMVVEELSFTPSTAHRYANTFRHLRRLHYNKAESLSLLKKCGYSHLSDVLPNMKDKIGYRAIRKRIRALNQNQINFTVTDKELTETHRALAKMGAVQSDHGRFLNSSQAFMDMVKEVNKRPVLKAVA